MRVVDEERRYLDTVRERIANDLVYEGLEEPDSDRNTLDAVTKAVLAALRTSEACALAAENNSAEDFATSFSRLRQLIKAAGPLWRQSAALYASATRWPGSGFGGLKYASLHHLVWGEARTLHLLGTELACHEELIHCGDSQLDLDPTSEKISAAWSLIRRAILQSSAVDTSDAEIRLADELARAKAGLEAGPTTFEESVAEAPTGSDRNAANAQPAKDGPVARGVWAYSGKLHEGMPPKPWVTAKCLFDAMPNSVEASTITTEVEDVNSLALEGDVKNWQRDAKAYFKREGIPLTISKSGATFRMSVLAQS